jgi:formate hydrogenlyase subunit 6/NADH:ubiquinone oxidoreductase subunit I
MKTASMFSDVLSSVFRKPSTQNYPAQQYATPERLRGALNWDAEKCTGCGLCAMDCPAQALDMIVIDRKAKRFVLRYYLDRCTFCAQCVYSCRQGCLDMSSTDWELAALDHDSYCLVYGTEDDIREALGE